MAVVRCVQYDRVSSVLTITYTTNTGDCRFLRMPVRIQYLRSLLSSNTMAESCVRAIRSYDS